MVSRCGGRIMGGEKAKSTSASRWRLILGKHSQRPLEEFLNEEPENTESAYQKDEINSETNPPVGYDNLEKNEKGMKDNWIEGNEKAYDGMLEFLYGRKVENDSVEVFAGSRFAVLDEISRLKNREGSQAESRLITVPKWVDRVKELFPKESAEIMMKDALGRFKMTEIMSKPEILEQVEPSYEMAKLLLTFKSYLNAGTKEIARKIIAKTMKDLEAQFRNEVIQALMGKKSPIITHRRRSSKNFDFKTTVRRNLKHWNSERGELVLEKPYYSTRIKNHFPWHIILVIDQSGSMLDSIIHSAVVGSIFASLKSIKTSLILFDTKVVDLSEMADDPLNVLLSVQLGGGTAIGKAVAYAARLMAEQARTILVLVTDF